MTSPLSPGSDIPVAIISAREYPSYKRWWDSVVSDEAMGLGPSASRLVLRAGAQLYLLGLKLNLGLYTSGLKGFTQPALSTISVGNLTLGGTGKTTVVQFLAHRLQQQNIIPGIVLRGYGRTGCERAILVTDGEQSAGREAGAPLLSPSEAGDEAYMLAQILPEVPVAVSKRRELAIKLLAERTAAQIALLDDGFQYFRMSKLVDIVLMDATAPLASQRLFPAGYLREPLSHLRRADQIWITHADQAGPEAVDKLRHTLATVAPEALVVVTRHRIASVHALTGEAITPGDFADMRILAVSGIGNPQSFETSLQQAGAQVVALRYGDHHDYCRADMQYIQQIAQEHEVDLVACTPKDVVKWSQADWPMSVAVVHCELEILEGDHNVQSIVDRAEQVVAGTEYD